MTEHTRRIIELLFFHGTDAAVRRIFADLVEPYRDALLPDKKVARVFAAWLRNGKEGIASTTGTTGLQDAMLHAKDVTAHDAAVELVQRVWLGFADRIRMESKREHTRIRIAIARKNLRLAKSEAQLRDEMNGFLGGLAAAKVERLHRLAGSYSLGTIDRSKYPTEGDSTP